MDFPAEYSANKKFTSCVRRRKWIRYRKYIAMDSWSSVPGIGEDSCPLDKSQFFKQKPQSVEQEPFLDLAIGGNEIPGTYISFGFKIANTTGQWFRSNMNPLLVCL